MKTKIKLAFYIIILLFSVISQPLMAQETEDHLYNLSLEQLMNLEVITASRQSESILKTPVPTTVITREMINAIGARNIKEVLTTYVPGMTAVEDHNEMNVAMRGVYASSQQKILFMINGQRINSRAYSMANPDYSISLDKVKQIEVLRGPGSSLYGNVSLSGVVNIITMKGEEINGTQLRVAGGNNGQMLLSAVAGTSLGENKDILVWGYRYDAAGERRKISAADDYSSNTSQDGVAYLGAVQGDYDLGVQAQVGKFDFLFNATKGKIQPPFSDGGVTGEIYNADDYDEIIGEEPGLGQEMRRLKIGYKTSAGNFDFEIDAYADQSNLIGHVVSAPASLTNLAVFWWDRDIGGIAQATYNYPKGNVLVGTQVDWMGVYDSFFALSNDGTGVLNTFLDTSVPLLEEGQEVIYSGFTQWKHNFTNKLLLNAGLRYDNKDRHRGPNVDALSPRLALIMEASKTQNIKFSYSKSFVDAPYWYRYNSLASYAGSADLKPENLEAIQLSLDSKLFGGKLFNNVNVYYQSLTDNIYRDPNATGDDPRYRNAGSLKSWGIEEQATMRFDKLDIMFNATYQYAISASDYEIDETKIANVPSFSTNIIGIYKFNDNFFFNVGLKYQSSQFSPITAVGSDVSVPDNYIDGAFIINAGVNLKVKDLVLDLRVKNLADTDYLQGGSTRFAYPQEGRWITASLRYTFKNN